MSNEKIIDKVKKLLALAACPGAGATEAETALRQAQKLMAEHDLAEEDLARAEVGEERQQGGAKITPSRWETALAGACGNVFGCKTVFGGKIFLLRPKSHWSFVGIQPNRAIAAYAFHVLYRQAKAARKQYIADKLKRCTKTKTQRADLYMEGWVASAIGKLTKLTVPQGVEQAIGDYMQTHFNLKKLEVKDRNPGKLNATKMHDLMNGVNDGNNVQLHNGVGTAAATPKRLA